MACVMSFYLIIFPHNRVYMRLVVNAGSMHRDDQKELPILLNIWHLMAHNNIRKIKLLI